MLTTSTRRELLTAAGAAGALVFTPHAMAHTAQDPVEKKKSGPWFEISLAQWSLHKALFDKSLEHIDFAKAARETYGVGAVEYVNSFFSDHAGDFRYLGEMKKRAADHGVKNLLIMVDGEGSLAAEDDAERRQAIENHFKWIAAAGYLGCHSIRVNAAGSGDPREMQRRAADSLVRLADLGQPYGIQVIVENHGGLSSKGEWLAGVMKIAADERVGTLPDFGNFRISADEVYDRYKGVEELMPFAKAVSAKAHDFDEQGNEIHTDYKRMLGIVKEAGYRGFVGIEFEGGKISESEGILATRRLLERVRKELS